MILEKQIRNFYQRFISLKGEPVQIAAGVAIGVFVGVTPTIPFHTGIIALIALVFRQNVTAGYLGAWIISNPLTVPLLYLSQYELGRILLGMERNPLMITDFTLGGITELGGEILLPLLTGGVLMAPFFAVPAYFIAHRMIKVIRSRRLS